MAWVYSASLEEGSFPSGVGFACVAFEILGIGWVVGCPHPLHLVLCEKCVN